MSNQLKQGFLVTLLVVVIVSIYVMLLTFIPRALSLSEYVMLWAAFIAFPTAFISNPTIQRAPMMILNLAIGQLIGILCVVVGGMAFAAFGDIGSCVFSGLCSGLTVLITFVLMGKYGQCALAFVAFVGVFVIYSADPMLNIALFVMMCCGILAAVVVGAAAGWAARVIPAGPETTEE